MDAEFMLLSTRLLHQVAPSSHIVGDLLIWLRFAGFDLSLIDDEIDLHCVVQLLLFEENK
jgi:hypothetical protein